MYKDLSIKWCFSWYVLGGIIEGVCAHTCAFVCVSEIVHRSDSVQRTSA